MKNGLAIWHYPQRSLIENILFFAEKGFTSLSSLGCHFIDAARDPETRSKLAESIKENRIVFTVHHKLPYTEYPDELFFLEIQAAKAWQDDFGLLTTLSFDVPQEIRHNARPYIDYVLEAFQGTDTRIAVEDFGLTPNEKIQIDHLKQNPQFGFLIDIGHMNLRLRDQGEQTLTLFTQSNEASPLPTGDVSDQAFENAFHCKEFPIYEIHLHNNDGKQDLHDFLENGTVNILSIAKILKKLKYQDVLTIESVPPWQNLKNEDGDTAILQTYEYWCHILQDVSI